MRTQRICVSTSRACFIIDDGAPAATIYARDGGRYVAKRPERWVCFSSCAHPLLADPIYRKELLMAKKVPPDDVQAALDEAAQVLKDGLTPEQKKEFGTWVVPVPKNQTAGPCESTDVSRVRDARRELQEGMNGLFATEPGALRSPPQQSGNTPPSSIDPFADIHVDVDEDRCQLTYGGKSVDFSNAGIPWKLAVYLVQGKGSWLHRNRLMDVAWDENDIVDHKNLPPHLTRVRKLVNPIGLTVGNDRSGCYRIQILPTELAARNEQK